MRVKEREKGKQSGRGTLGSDLVSKNEQCLDSEFHKGDTKNLRPRDEMKLKLYTSNTAGYKLLF